MPTSKPFLAAAAAALALPGLAAAQDVARGQQVFKPCAVCHTVEQGGKNGLGPNLFGVAGAKAAAKPGFAYSPALKKANLTWTDDNLDKWFAAPTKFVPGNRMASPPVAKAEDRAALIAYLKSKR